MYRSPPSAAELSRALGFRAPSDFVELVHLSIALHRERRADDLECLLGSFPTGVLESLGGLDRWCDIRTPPEYFPILSVGADGASYGYIVHAPELDEEDWPVGDYCPMDSDGVILLGRDTREAIENLISENLEYRLEEGAQIPRDLLERFATHLRIAPDPSKSKRRWPTEDGAPVPPNHTPPGWRFLMTTDGVGTLAPAPLFRDSHDDAGLEPRELLSRAEADFAAGYFASALTRAREAYWNGLPEDSDDEKVNTLIIETYHQLGRPTLARRAAHRRAWLTP
jgi:hypothetical protein